MSNKKISVSIRVDEDVLNLIDEVSKRIGTSRNILINMELSKLKDMIGYYETIIQMAKEKQKEKEG